MVNVLKTPNIIESGDIFVEVDRKKKTGYFVIQYNDVIFNFDQTIRIKYGLGAGFALDKFKEDEPDGNGSITFHFKGTIIVWLTELNNADQKIVACPDQTVDITLHRSAGQ